MINTRRSAWSGKRRGPAIIADMGNARYVNGIAGWKIPPEDCTTADEVKEYRGSDGATLIEFFGPPSGYFFMPDVIYVDVSDKMCPVDRDFDEIDHAFLPVAEQVPGVAVMTDGGIQRWTGVAPLDPAGLRRNGDELWRNGCATGG